MSCDHAASHSGAARFVRESSQLRMTLVCDLCGAERREIGRIDYRPRGRRIAGLLAELTARELGLREPQIARVRFASLICDVGRDQIPHEILNKRGPLSDEEWVEIRRQPELGAALLADTSFDDLREWIRTRRERPDGRGYPHGLAGAQIPIEARILAVTDAYLAMITDRPHRSALTHEQAEQELLQASGTQFDATVVGAFRRAAARHGTDGGGGLPSALAGAA